MCCEELDGITYLKVLSQNLDSQTEFKINAKHLCVSCTSLLAMLFTVLCVLGCIDIGMYT